MRRQFSPLDFWRGFIDSLDTGGGHIFIALFVLLVGVWCYMHIDATAGGQVMTGAMTALWVMLKTQKSNREQMSASATVTATAQSTEGATSIVPAAASSVDPIPTSAPLS